MHTISRSVLRPGRVHSTPPRRLPTPLPFCYGGMAHQIAPEHSEVAFVYLIVQYLSRFTYGRVLVTFLLLR